MAMLEAQTINPRHPNTSKKARVCYLITKTTVYTENVIDICRHKVTHNSYKYELQALSTGHIRDKNKKIRPLCLTASTIICD